MKNTKNQQKAIHHIDGKPNNNTPENLEDVDIKDHAKAYSLTLKGWFAVKAMKCQTLDDATVFWDELAEKVKEDAFKNGYDNGIPTLVFTQGGYGLTAQANEI